MRAILARGLEATAGAWPEIRTAFCWVWRFASILGNKRGRDAAGVRRRYRELIAALARRRESLGGLGGTFDHFRKVTRSYWAGLFRCYGVADLPLTNNDPERFFGSYRQDERPEGGLPGDGGARVGAAGGVGGDAAEAGRGPGPGAVGPFALA